MVNCLFGRAAVSLRRLPRLDDGAKITRQSPLGDCRLARGNARLDIRRLEAES